MTFHAEDLKTPLPRAVLVQDDARIVDRARGGAAGFTSADRQASEYAIRPGRGAAWFRSTGEPD